MHWSQLVQTATNKIMAMVIMAKHRRKREKAGLTAAIALHVVVIGLLSVQWTAGDRRFDNPPMEVDLIAETAATSTAPIISETPPAARLGDEYSTDLSPPQPLVAPPVPEPIEAPQPAPAPKTTQRPVPAKPKPAASKPNPPKAAAAKPSAPKATRPTGRLDGLVDGLSPNATKSPSKGAPAAATAAEVKKSIDVSIKSAVGPRWDSCRISGVDVNELKTEVKFRLTQSGALAGFTSVTTTGQNESNRFQVARHQECAKRAIELAAPFDLPKENYSYWQNYTLDFDKVR